MKALDLVFFVEKGFVFSMKPYNSFSQKVKLFTKLDYKSFKDCHIEATPTTIKITKGWCLPHNLKGLVHPVKDGYWVFSFIPYPVEYYEYKRFKTFGGAMILFRRIMRSNKKVCGVLVFRVKRGKFKLCYYIR